MRQSVLAWLLASSAVAALPPPPAFQLPAGVIPLKHTIELTIDPARETFDGIARIAVDIRQPAGVVWMNARDIVPETEAVLSRGNTSVRARAWVSGKEFIGIETGGRTGAWTISIRYHGRIDDKAVLGPYRRKVGGDWYVYTTFTPIEARRAFPCFDEPRFKTPWEISIRVPAGNKAFSNARETGETEDPNGWKLIHFAPTDPLPAEVVAFAVGPFDVYEGMSAGHGTPIRVITPRGRAAEGKDAAEATVAVLPELEEYTGIPYPFGKLDHVALADAAFGAVENPGLIVYLAKELLVAPPAETPPRLYALRYLEAHEIGHQWFGDLVTQADWNDVWLSEGFATWISLKVMDREQAPERVHLGAITGRERMMALDGSPRTRPVRVIVRSREASRDIYNRVVYEKGGALLLMLEGWLGEDKVQQAVRDYLTARRFGHATTADLAEALKRAAGTDPSNVMHTLLDTTGVPHVSAQIECKDAPRLKIRETGPGPIPVCYRGDGITRGCALMDGPARDIELPPGSACPSWMYLNAGGTGYYRSDFSTAQLAALPVSQLTPAERLTLAYDLKAQGSVAAREVLSKLASDAEPEIAAAATRTARTK